MFMGDILRINNIKTLNKTYQNRELMLKYCWEIAIVVNCKTRLVNRKIKHLFEFLAIYIVISNGR